MYKIWLILPILFLYGCCGMFGKKISVIEVGNPEQVEDCRLLKKFTHHGSGKTGGDSHHVQIGT